MFSLDVALKMKLDLGTLPTSITEGIGNTNNLTYHAEVTIDLPRGMSFKTKAAFSDGLTEKAFGLLGQSGFFSGFNVEFRLAENLFTIEPAASPAIH